MRRRRRAHAGHQEPREFPWSAVLLVTAFVVYVAVVAHLAIISDPYTR
ncbi:hypothetical protein [Streptomyces sp. NPDC051162]